MAGLSICGAGSGSVAGRAGLCNPATSGGRMTVRGSSNAVEVLGIFNLAIFDSQHDRYLMGIAIPAFGIAAQNAVDRLRGEAVLSRPTRNADSIAPKFLADFFRSLQYTTLHERD